MHSPALELHHESKKHWCRVFFITESTWFSASASEATALYKSIYYYYYTIDQFSKFFHLCTEQEICNKVIHHTWWPCYTTLWNINVRKLIVLCSGSFLLKGGLVKVVTCRKQQLQYNLFNPTFLLTYCINFQYYL